MKMLTVHRLTTFTRNGAGGSQACVVVEPEPLTAPQRQEVARALGTLTAFVPATTPDPMPTAFFDPNGERSTGEQALIAVFRALALTGRTIARRVLLDTARGQVAVQEEVFRRPSQAQVWIELEVPVLTRIDAALLELRAGLGITNESRAWSAGPLLVLEGGSLEQVRSARLDPRFLREAMPTGLEELLLFTLESSSPFSDVHVRHMTTRGEGTEHPASVAANAALGTALWQEGLQKTYLLVEQGADIGIPCRVSVWLEGEGPAVLRVSVGGQVSELERFEQPWPDESVERP